MKLGLERRVVQVLLDAVLQALECRHQRFGYIATAERAEAAAIIRHVAFDGRVEKRFRFVRSKQCAHNFSPRLSPH